MHVVRGEKVVYERRQNPRGSGRTLSDSERARFVGLIDEYPTEDASCGSRNGQPTERLR